jgi:hypothetical protein
LIEIPKAVIKRLVHVKPFLRLLALAGGIHIRQEVRHGHKHPGALLTLFDHVLHIQEQQFGVVAEWARSPRQEIACSTFRALTPSPRGGTTAGRQPSPRLSLSLSLSLQAQPAMFTMQGMTPNRLGIFFARATIVTLVRKTVLAGHGLGDAPHSMPANRVSD